MNARASTILLVEDDENDVMLLERAFRRARLANPVQHVTDGDAAVEYLRGAGRFADRDLYPLPVLLILDLKLPRRSGFEVLEWIRQQPGLRRLRVVILTSSRQSVDVNRAYELGANSYLVKPVELDGLIEMVKALDLYWFVMNEQPEVEDG